MEKGLDSSMFEGRTVEGGIELEHNSEKLQAEKPSFSIYLIRHGETSKDKSNPSRALTDKGEDEVREAVASVIKQLIREEKPDFDQFDDETACLKVFEEIAPRISFRLYDSGTARTLQQVAIEKHELGRDGVEPENIYIPESVRQFLKNNYDHVDVGDQSTGPGIQDRLEGVRGVDQDSTGFRQKIADPEYQKRLGADDEIIAWALSPEDEIPKDVENIDTMIRRVKENLQKVQNVAPRIAERIPEGKRIVVLANSHASNVTVTSAAGLGKSIKELGGVGTGEGVRLDFFASGAEHTAAPFGEKIEAKIGSLS